MNKILYLLKNFLKTKKPFMNNNEISKSPEYSIENGIRYVKPYFTIIKTTVKTRWLNRTVLDILSTEFRNFSLSEYKNRIEKDEIVVIHKKRLTKKERKNLRTTNNKIDNTEIIKYPEILDYKLVDNDLIQRIEHIHERSVIGVESKNIEVIYDDENLLVVNKPSGIPIHPVQNYYYNSFVQILQVEGWSGVKDNLNNIQLRPCYRLDKLTSGICIFAKNNKIASKIQTEIQDKNVEKIYLARVSGKFPELDEITKSKKIECNDDVIVLDTKKGKKDGIMRKNAQTIFELVKYNKILDQSIVMCWPKTGRTHQIRIHLRNLNHPIINDPLYGNKGIMSLANIGNNVNDITDDCFEKIQKQAVKKRMEKESHDCCDVCGIYLYEQTKKEDLVMYLHAFEYKFNNNSDNNYRTKWPVWCDI